MSKIDSKKLKSIVKLVNESGILEKVDLKNIRTVGVKMETILEDFGDAVDALADKELQGKLDPSVISYYNEAFDDADPKDEEKTNPKDEEKTDPEPKKEKEKEKEKEKPATKKNPAASKKRSCFGHIASAKSGMLDELLTNGATYADLMKKCEVKLHRVKGHINVLKKKGLTVLFKEDKKDPEKSHVQIKEDSI